jgi:hypothetical protein
MESVIVHRLLNVVQPPNELWDAPKMLWEVGEHPLLMKWASICGSRKVREGIAGQFALHERVEVV